MKSIKNCVLLLSCLGLAACQAADGTSQAPDIALVNGLMSGLGAVDPNEKPIDYKPRAPLAMPAKMDALPQPETEVAANNSGNWPTKEGNREFEELKEVYAKSNGTERLTPDQMRGFTISNVDSRERRSAQDAREVELGEGAVMTRQELASGHRSNVTEETVSIESRLQRKYLTEPPTAYNEPSAAAPVPEIVRVEKTKDESALDNSLVDMRCLEETGGSCRRNRQ